MAMTEILFEKPPKKKKWWKTNRGLIIILLVLICIVLGGYTYYLRFGNAGNICTTTECLKASVGILSSMDQSVDPCDDFYSFSCGNFIKGAYERKDPFPQLAQKLRRNNQINGIIASPITGEEWTPLLLQKTFYQSCKNESALDEDDNQTLMTIIEELGGWPVIKGQDWVFEDFELDTIMVKSKELGLPFQWFFTILPAVWTNQILIGIPDKDPVFNEPFKESVYFDLMVETAVALGGSRSVAKTELEKVLDFERSLIQILKNYKLSNSIEINYDDMAVIFSNNDLSSLIEELIDDVFTYSENTTILVNENVMNEINLLIAGTSRRTCVNFFIWKIIRDFGLFLASPIRENFRDFSNFISNRKIVSRSDLCLEEAKKRFPNIAKASYIEKYADDKTVRNVEELISNIKKRFIARITGANWISNSSKKMAVEKIENVIEIIGDQSSEFNSSLLDKLVNIGNLSFTTDNIIDMAREKNINDFRNQFLVQITPVDKLTEFIFNSVTEVNAAYILAFNIMVISAAIMQDIFYSAQRPNYLNYGSLGMILGHELAHGYDRHASFQDPVQIFAESWQNVLDSTPLWDNETLDEIIAKTACLRDQYTEFLNGGERDDTEHILRENFADLLGVDIAYEAYVAWWKIHGKEEKSLPGLPYNPKQMFWIQFANSFCYEEDIAKEFGIRDFKHAPFNYRVLSPLKNSRNFPLDFKCSPGTKMNPVEKCFVF